MNFKEMAIELGRISVTIGTLDRLGLPAIAFWSLVTPLNHCIERYSYSMSFFSLHMILD